MRLNEPITAREIEFDEDDVLVSRTDPGGRIVFCNEAFTKISGFTTEELLGAPHNIVRHPHMPSAAFADLWATIKAGRPWDGLVKNRSKSGDHYWVRANVTPVRDGDTVTGYISIRSRPTAQEKSQAETIYAAMRDGRHTGYGLHDGALVRTGWRARLATWRDSISLRIAAAILVMMMAVLGIAAVTLDGMQDSNDALRDVYANGIVPAALLTTSQSRLESSRTALAELALDLRAGAPVASRVAAMRTALDQAAAGWAAYLETRVPASSREVAERHRAARDAYLRDAVAPALALAEAGNGDALERHIREVVPALFAATVDTLKVLAEQQAKLGSEAYAEAQEDFTWHAGLAIGIAIIAALLSAGAGAVAVRGLRQHLHTLEEQFVAIAANRLSDPIPVPAAREFGRLTTLLRMLRARIAFTEAERGENDRLAATERRAVIGMLAEKVETESVAAVSSVATRTDAIAGEAEAVASIAEALSGRAGGMAHASSEARDAVEAVAAASEELAASIREITTQAARTGEITRRAVAGGETAAETIGRLSETVGRIGEVVHLIRAVAGQTNLLALNATIEAARAGEAGKGFAVVAGEVKGLAGQTAHSTEEIGRHIAEVQASTEAVVAAVTDIGTMITDIAEAAGAIAAAMEEQATVTQEIARNVAQSGIAVRRMSDEADAVSLAARDAGSRAQGVSAQTAAVNSEVASLQDKLTGVVRTSLDNADRRMSESYPVSEDCTVDFGGSHKEGRLVSASLFGALVSGIAGAREGDALVVTLPARGGLRRSFTVRGVTAHGLHVELAEEDVGKAWETAVNAMRPVKGRRVA